MNRARAHTRDVAFFLRQAEVAARFAEHHGAPNEIRHVRALTEKLRRKAAEVERRCAA